MRVATAGGTISWSRFLLAVCWVAGWSLLVAQTCPSPTIKYVYDENGRLVAVVDNGATGSNAAIYRYDPAGNIIGIERQTAATLAVLAFSPSCGVSGAGVTITGVGFDPVAGNNTVKFNGTTATVTAASQTRLTATVPAGATTGAVQVTVGASSASSGRSFAIGCGGPTITDIQPRSGVAGDSVTVTGTNFQLVAADNRVRFNGNEAGLTTPGPTSTLLTTKVPPSATSGRVTESTVFGTATSPVDFFVAPPGFATAELDPAGLKRLIIDGPTVSPSIGANRIGLVIYDATIGQRITLATSGSTIAGQAFSVRSPNGATVFGPVTIGTPAEVFPLATSHAAGTYTILLDPGSTNAGSITLRGVTETASVTGPASTVIPGASVSVSWSGIAIPTAKDWIGLYAAGADAFSAWVYTTNTASGSLSFPIPPAVPSGDYEFRLLSNDKHNVLATSARFGVVACATTTLGASPASVIRGGTTTATWSGICVPKTNDQIAMFAPGASDTSASAALISTGSTTGSGNKLLQVPPSTAPGTYELRLFAQGNRNAKLATSGTFVVTACTGATLSGSPGSVVQGASVSATWGGICVPAANDQVAMFVPGASDTSSSVNFVSTGSTAAGGNKQLIVPPNTPAGTYELRLFSQGDRNAKLATSGTFTVTACTGAILGRSPASIVQGGGVTATWSGICAPQTADQIAMFAPGASDTSTSITWMSTGTTTTSGNKILIVPPTTAPGTYELRLFAQGNRNAKLATSATFTVTACTGTVLNRSPASLIQGSNVTATWTNICAPHDGDQIAMFEPSAADTSSPITWGSTPNGGTGAGNISLAVPPSTPPGTYELRLFAQGNRSAKIATSSTFTVTACTGATLSRSASSVVQGSSLTATWSGICVPHNGDLIAMFAPGASDTTAPVAWASTPNGGTGSGNMDLEIPPSTAPGTYELRLFAQGSRSAKLATSGTFTVTACTGAALSGSPGSVVRGDNITATWNGICAPNNSDLIGMFPPGASDTADVVAAISTPNGGTGSGNIALAIPPGTPPGSYELRLFAHGSRSAKLATSGIFTVTACAGAAVSASPSSVVRGNNLTATWTGICFPHNDDFIGIFVPGESDVANPVAGISTPNGGTGAGNIALTVPANTTAGSYELRLFAQGDRSAKLATSGPFAVTE